MAQSLSYTMVLEIFIPLTNGKGSLQSTFRKRHFVLKVGSIHAAEKTRMDSSVYTFAEQSQFLEHS